MKYITSNVHLYRLNDYVQKPWRNGQGSTLEVTASTDYQGLIDGRWRVSIASLDKDSAYSDFSGYKRSQVMLQGESVCLAIQQPGNALQPGNAQQQLVMRPLSFLTFDGGAEVSCKLQCDGAKMFNVMSRHNQVSHSLEALYGGDLPSSINSDEETLLLFSLESNVEVLIDQQSFFLGQFDLLEIQQPTNQSIRVRSAGGMRVAGIIVRIENAPLYSSEHERVNKGLGSSLEQF